MKKILFIDDAVDLLTTMKNFLGQKGFDVAVSTSCKDGLEILRTFRPDLILLDVHVGVEDGRLMCRQIKGQAEYAHIPVILVSAEEEPQKTYREFAADNIVLKPFQLSSLVGTLNVYL